MRQGLQISDDELKLKYEQNIQDYQVPNRVHAEHILLMTVNKTDAEVEEIKKKAEDVLKQVKKGAKFDELAKKYSEDPGSKDKGGDLGWLIQGQTVPEFEKAAFSLQAGAVSDLVKTQYGFHIIKVLEKETAHTKSFEEVKDSIRAPLLSQKPTTAPANLPTNSRRKSENRTVPRSPISRNSFTWKWLKPGRLLQRIHFLSLATLPRSRTPFSGYERAKLASPFERIAATSCLL